MKRSTAIAVSTLSLTLALYGTSAWAQDASIGTGGAGQSDRIDEIVVTAQFREQNLQDTPLAITAVTGDMMEQRSQVSVSDVANRAPSVTLTTAGANGGGAQSFQASIRGIGQVDFNLALEPGVGTYVDDVYYGIMVGTTFELLDLERIELLRGPQGTLSGKNSEGGAIKLFSKVPDNETSGYVSATYGSFNRVDLRGSANFPLIADRLFIRLSGLARERDGYLTRLDYKCATGNDPSPINSPGSEVTNSNSCKIGTEGGQSVVALRGAMRLIVNDDIENTLSVDFTNDKSEPTPNVLIAQGTWHGTGYDFTASPPILNTTQNFAMPGTYVNYATYRSLVGLPSEYSVPAISHLRMWGIANTLDIRLGDSLALKSITAFRHAEQESNTDGDASPINRLAQFIQFDHDQFTQELRLSGQVGDFADWTLGGFYYDATSWQGGRVAIDGAGDGVVDPVPFFQTFDFTYHEPIKVTSKSVFAHVVLHPAPGLDITGGVRYTDDKKDFVYYRALVPGTPPSFLSDSVLPLDGQSETFSGKRWDWRAAVAYRVTPDLNIYGQIATGFKGGGVNPRPFYPTQIQTFEPETVTSYEIGFKSDLFDRRMRFNVAAYINKFSDMQLTLTQCPAFIPEGLPPNCYLPANVGDSTIKGFEIETEIRPVDGLLIDGSVSYTHFQYDSLDASTGISLQYKAPYTPEWKASIGIQYEFPLGSIGTLTPRFDYIYQSEMFTEVLNDPYNTVQAYGIANARLTFRDANDDWQLDVGVTNLFDKYYYANLFDRLSNNNSFQLLAGEPGRPREWSVTLRRNF